MTAQRVCLPCLRSVILISSCIHARLDDGKQPMGSCRLLGEMKGQARVECTASHAILLCNMRTKQPSSRLTAAVSSS
jgi:hypothetical protein